MKRALFRFAAALLLVLGAPLVASAHATLVESDPADGDRLDTGPGEVTLLFSEPIDVPVAAIRVYDGAGERVDSGDSAPGPSAEMVRVTLPGSVSAGTYVVTWGVVSLDGHPIRGAFTFQIGEGETGADPSLVASLLGDGNGGVYAAAGAVARWITYLGGLGAAGVVVFVWLARRRDLDTALARLAKGAAVVAAAGSIIQIPLFAAEVTGLGVAAIGSASALIDALSSPLGVAALVRVAALGVLAWAARGQRLPPSIWVGIGGLVVAELLTGHTRTTEPAWLVIGADAVHVFVAAVWLGGLAALFIVLRPGGEDAASAAAAVGKFSAMAGWSVVGATVAGLALAWAEVRTFGALTSTPYGWTLVAKIVIVMAVIAVGAYNNRVLVPSITGSREGFLADGGSGIDTLTRTAIATRSKLRRLLGIELTGLAVVLAVTALLVNLPPAAEAAGVSGPYSTYVAFGEGQLNLVVDPNQIGPNQIHAYVLSASGSPIPAEGAAAMEFRLPSEEVGPFIVEPRSAGPGHWVHTGPELALPGAWQITFRLTSGFEESTAAATVRVNP